MSIDQEEKDQLLERLKTDREDLLFRVGLTKKILESQELELRHKNERIVEIENLIVAPSYVKIFGKI